MLAEHFDGLSAAVGGVNRVVRVENHFQRFSRTHLVVDN
jgi:hypothetical protein